MNDGGSNLRLDVVPNNGQAGIGESLLPIWFPRNEDRHAVDDGDAGRKGLLHVPLCCHLTADGQVADQDIDLPLAQDSNDVCRLPPAFLIFFERNSPSPS